MTALLNSEGILGVAGYATEATAHRLARAIFYIAMSVWAYEEARHGDNWFRHLLGLGFGLYIVVRLTQDLHA